MLNEIIRQDHNCYLVKVRLDIDNGGSSDPGIGPDAGDTLGGIDFTANNINVSEYGDKFKYKIDEELKRKIFSDEFRGFFAHIENVLPLNSINEIID